MDLFNFKCPTSIAQNQLFLLRQKHETVVKPHILADLFTFVKYLGISETH